MSSLLSEDSYTRHGVITDEQQWFSRYHPKTRTNSNIELHNYLSNVSTSPSYPNFNSWTSRLLNNNSDMFEENQPYNNGSLSTATTSFLWNQFPLSNNHEIKKSNLKHFHSDRGAISNGIHSDAKFSTIFLPKPSANQSGEDNRCISSLLKNKDYRVNENNEKNSFGSRRGSNLEQASTSYYRSDSYRNRYHQPYQFNETHIPIEMNYNEPDNAIKNPQNTDLVNLWTTMCENSELHLRQISSNEKEILLEILERLKRNHENMLNKVSRAIETIEINTLPDKDTFVELLTNFCALSSNGQQEDNPLKGIYSSTNKSIHKNEANTHNSSMHSQNLIGELSNSESILNLSSSSSTHTHDKPILTKQSNKDYTLWSEHIEIQNNNQNIIRSINEPMIKLPKDMDSEKEASSTQSLVNVQNNYDVSIHESGKCKPCAFYYNKKKGCKNGAECSFCHHEDHAKHTLKQWKKHQKFLEEQDKLNGEHDNRTKVMKDLKMENIHIPKHGNELDVRSLANLNQKFQSNGPAPGLEMNGPDYLLKKLGIFPIK